MGSVGASRSRGGGGLNNIPPTNASSSIMPWTKAGYDMYRKEISGATEIWFNPDSHQIVFLANEAPVTPVFSGYAESVVGTDRQVKELLESLWAGKSVRITRRF